MFMMFWTIVLIAYPLIAMLESQIAVLEFIPIVAIGAGFLVACWRMPISRLLTVGLLSILGAAAFFLAYQLLATPSYEGKIGHFLLVIVAFGVMLGTCLQDERFLSRLPAALLILGGIALVLLVFNPSGYQEGRESYGDGNPIWMARCMSLAGVGAIWYIAHKGRLWAWGVLAVVIAAMTLTGSRGPIVALAIAAAYSLVNLSPKRRVQFAIAGVYLFAMLVLIQVGYDIIPDMRALSFGSTNGREFLYQYAADQIYLNPYGIGVGNFQFRQFSYPHNIILEFLTEWGWVLGGAVIALIVAGGVRLFRAPEEYNILKLVFIVEIVNAQFSGDITTPRMLYALVFVGLFFCPAKRTKHHASVPNNTVSNRISPAVPGGT